MTTFKQRSKAAKKGAKTKKRNKFIAAWLKALRSGKFKQGKKVLCDVSGKTPRYCCLGVACVVAQELNLLPIKKETEDGCVFFNDIVEVLANDITNAVGLRTANGEFYDGAGTSTLSRLNDEGMSFKKIADIIESRPKGLFVE